LFEIDADAAKEDPFVTNVLLISARGCVDREEGYVMTSGKQFGGESVVAQTATAVHLTRAAGEIKNFHNGF
jgi:hypothetical protein